MSASEFVEIRAGVRRNRSSRVRLFFAVALLGVLTIAALLVVSRGARHTARGVSEAGLTIPPVTPANSWSIRGALSEACTCVVPCTCNFGQGPSPHGYCYPFYSYDIHEGGYGETKLDGLHFGAADLKGGRTIFIDERADERQRAALRLIAVRVIEHASAAEAEVKAAELAPHIRYAAVRQEYDGRRNHLSVAGIGEFAADYIMGLDGSHPVVVRNNTTWRIRDAVKAKTSLYRVRVGRDRLDTKNTNSNQGEFEYTDRTDFGGAAEWGCGSSANDAGSCHVKEKGE